MPTETPKATAIPPRVGRATKPVVLGEDEYFVLGDNRNSSEDSRSGNIGAVRKDTIIGKAWFHMEVGDESMGLIE